MASAMAKAQKMAEDAVECVDLSSDDENADTGKIFIPNFFEFEKAYESACIFPVLAKEVHVSVCRFKSQPYLAPSSSISIVWREDSWGRACRRRQLSALQTMEMPLDGANTADS